MKKFLTLYLLLLNVLYASSQTPLTTAPDFSVKTVDGTVIQLYPLLDSGKVVTLNFFSVSCGPCQLYAPHFQGAFEAFGRNLGNVFFLGINYNGTNPDVIFFDSVFNLTFPAASGLDGGGNSVFHLFQLAAYPTVLVIRPDKVIANPYIWPPTTENIIDAVVTAGGTLVGLPRKSTEKVFQVYPNPVRNSTTLALNLNFKTSVNVSLHDLNGKLVKQVVNSVIFDVGTHRINIATDDLPNGIFFVAITTDQERYFEKIIVQNH